MKIPLGFSGAHFEGEIIRVWDVGILTECAKHSLQVGVAEPIRDEHPEESAELEEFHPSGGTLLKMEMAGRWEFTSHFGYSQNFSFSGNYPRSDGK